MRRVMVAAIVAVVIASGAGVSHAGTRRIAVIVGNNAGNVGRVPLRYAELDAAKLGQVLGELGNVAPADLFVLQGKRIAVLDETFAVVKQQIDTFRKQPENRVVLLFYFSGHSDGEALELGPDRLTFSGLRRSLASLGADVRVVLIDSCKSGALLQVKGGKPGPGFQIRMTDDLASTGEALLTSSASDEVALESRSIAGSYFTHHLISGLRGAADTSGDGLVTLGEAYQYAYAHTVKTTEDTVVGAQHPGYDYRLTGQGELVLSELGKRTATLELPGAFDRIVVIDLARDQVTAEVTADTHVSIGVQSGRYSIHASRGGKSFGVDVVVTNGAVRVVRADELSATAIEATTEKGGEMHDRLGRIVVAGGGGAGVARHLGIVPGMRVDFVTPSGLSVAVTAGSAAGSGFRESSVGAFAGVRSTRAWGPWSGSLGVEVGGGVVAQTQLPQDAYSGVVAAAVTAGISFAVTPRTSVELETALPLELMKRDGQLAAVLAPAGWLGFGVRL
jgi:hypothetical protein